ESPTDFVQIDLNGCLPYEEEANVDLNIDPSYEEEEENNVELNVVPSYQGEEGTIGLMNVVLSYEGEEEGTVEFMNVPLPKKLELQLEYKK
ncbi:hypothetical protein A2U01_0056285, partial [Trifolium medium]|nr:hypothetical protein [Trifolium medium]